MGVKGNKRRINQFKNETGLYFVFADRVFTQVSEQKNIPKKKLIDFTIIYYIQKYMVGGRCLIMGNIIDIAKILGFNYTRVYMTRLLRYFTELGMLDYYGSKYHLTDDASNLLKSFGYWLHHNMVNFHNVIIDGQPVLKRKFGQDDVKKRVNIKKKEA